MLPFLPQEARNLRKFRRLWSTLSLMKLSLLMVQPTETDGKYPHFLSSGSLEESKASARKFAWTE